MRTRLPVPHLLLLGTSVVAACSPVGSPDMNPLAVQEPDPGEVVFLTQSIVPSAVMEALFDGRVTLDGSGCMRLGSAAGATVVWPKGFSLAAVGEGLRVLDERGREVGRVGGSFQLGGGEVPSLHTGMPVSRSDRRRAEELCPGRYWIVGDVLRS